MKIGIGNDHSAVEMKQDIAAYLEEKGYEVVNYGTDSHESCDYPVYGEKVGRAVAAGDVDFGIRPLPSEPRCPHRGYALYICDQQYCKAYLQFAQLR